MTRIYVMRASNGWVKVGMSAYPRLRTAQIKKPPGVRLRVVWEAAPHEAVSWIEQNVIRALRPYRVHKYEWFSCGTDKAIAAVLAVTARYDES